MSVKASRLVEVEPMKDQPSEDRADRSGIEIHDAVLNYPLNNTGGGSIKTAIFSRLGHRDLRPKLQFVEALKSVSTSIAHGERVGVIGTNGSGKSTFLRALAGVYPLESGSIRVDGRLGTLLDIGLGFETESTGRENIYYRGMAMGIAPAELRKVEEEIIKFADLDEFIDLPMRTYSSGMCVRLGFAISTQIDPDVLLIDEVFGAGDATFQERAMERMLQVVERAGIVVLASHDLGLVKRLCTRVLWFSKGVIRADGPPAQIVPQFLSYATGQPAAE